MTFLTQIFYLYERKILFSNSNKMPFSNTTDNNDKRFTKPENNIEEKEFLGIFP